MLPSGDSFEVEGEELLDRFRQWLRQARAEAEGLGARADGEPAGEGPEARDEIGLYRLVEEFTALRHELKLQTKSARNLQEQSEGLQASLRQAIEQFRSVEPRESEAAWAAGRPLAEALAELDEALDRGRAEIEKARRRLVEDAAAAVASGLDDLHARQSWLGRRLGRGYHQQCLELVRQQVLGPHRQVFDVLLEGYGLIQGRLRRTLRDHQVERIACVDRPVDPDLMTVIDVVDTPDQPPGHVVEEIRPGYTWRGRLLRYAEVRAARMQAEPSF